MRKMIAATFFLASVALLASFGSGCNSTQVSSGILYQNQDNHQKAVAMFREALLYNDEEAAAHYQLGWSLSILAKRHMQAGEEDSCRIKLGEAFDHYLLAKKYGPEDYDVTPERDTSPAEEAIANNYSHYFNQAVVYNESDNAVEAAKYFDLAYVADPRGERGFNAKINNIKLSLNVATENEDEAASLALLTELDKLTKAATTPEQQAELVNTKAIVLNNLGRRAEAAQLYEQLLADNPNDARLLERVADAKQQEGDSVAAADLMERLLAAVAGDPEVSREQRYAYALKTTAICYDAELYERCLKVAQTALQYSASQADSAAVQRRMLRCYFELERWSDAVVLAEQLINGTEAENASVWQVYYLSLDKDGRRDDAIVARERFLQLR